MSQQVCAGALLSCSFGTAPMPLSVLPLHRTLVGAPAANIMDNKPGMNVPPFVMCTSPGNPAVAAAMGAPQGCTPALTAPWVMGGAPTVLLDGQPTLNKASILMCTFGGLIQIGLPGQFTTQTP